MNNTEHGGPSGFRFQSRNIFLTYPRCNLAPELIGSFLLSLLSPYHVMFITVTSELHKDGTPHIHALAQTDKRVHTYSPGFFDVQGFHPNIQSARSPQTVLSYILKSPTGTFNYGSLRPRGTRADAACGIGEDTAGGGASSSSSPPQADQRRGSRSRELANDPGRDRKDVLMTSILAGSSSKQEFLNGVKKAFPYDFCARLQNWEYAANKLFDTPAVYQPPFPDSYFHCHENIHDWVRDNIYEITPEVYSLLHPYANAQEDLQWLHNTVMNRQDPSPSTSVDQQGQANQHGPEAWDDTTTGKIM
ncbi:RepA [Axonopus compressus streak virus]|uniref:Replication-associated protein n=1 Tax=Axonopus compressus streak virus TaxID=1476487 RepID=X2F2A2_9GEMI|nr:RepA [Axonopus compressus streak virus]AHM88320.1 RepA [Axonopus compressus streak virus]